jgi:CRISPR-associated protein Cas5t
MQAPFAAFRGFSGGWSQSTSDLMPPSSAYGLLLNLAAIEMRQYNDNPIKPTTIQSGLPKMELAIGFLQLPIKQQMLQQLHKIDQQPSKTDPEKQEAIKRTKGCKYSIAPITREFLSGFEAYVCVKTSIEDKIVDGIEGKFSRYGLPSLGDNNFFLNKIDVVNDLLPAFWVQRVGSNFDLERIQKLTIQIDRMNSAKTVSDLFGIGEKQVAIPSEAWIEVGY